MYIYIYILLNLAYVYVRRFKELTLKPVNISVYGTTR